MSSSLPSNLLLSLKATQPPRLLLIRHADRYKIPKGTFGEDVKLTPLGEQKAQLLGEHLKGEMHWGWASPLRRCMDTARHMGIHPKPSTLLGEPGVFVIDPMQCGELFKQYSTEFIVRAYVSGKDWKCMRSLEEGARMLLSSLFKTLKHAGSGVAITHDAIAMPVIAWSTGYCFEDDWLEPLDGVVLSTRGLTWMGHTYEVKL